MRKQRIPTTPSTPPYKNTSLSIVRRVDDLLARMTLREKAQQLCCILGAEVNWYNHTPFIRDGKLDMPVTRRLLGNGIGQIAMALAYLPPVKGARAANAIQKFLTTQTRLGIPAIIHEECLHGFKTITATSFPQAIALGAAWDPALTRRVGAAIGAEVRARGCNLVLTPTVNITTDPRCGRTEESYGEAVELVSRTAVAFIKGLQSNGIGATAKHFAANFAGDGGRDSHAIYFSERIMREKFFPAFKAAIREAKVAALMSAYNAFDGVPCSCNPWLLRTILRDEWKFDGITVSDYSAVRHISENHFAAPNDEQAGRLALEGGRTQNGCALCTGMRPGRTINRRNCRSSLDRARL
ncbi:MAG: hypothetical protein GF398_08745 [Chitinivibrionales bacterium]|nr:hypothetical protein [Chitinivibrionales bacterium]